MSASQRSFNQNEIDKCLEDAGVSDDLSFQEKLEFYNAIKVSKSFNKDTSLLREVDESEISIENENENTDFYYPVASIRRNKNTKQITQTSFKNVDESNWLLNEDFSEEQIKEKENEDPEWQPSTSNNNRQNKNLKRKLPNTFQHDNVKRKLNDVLHNDINIFDLTTSQHSSLTRIITPLVYEKPFLYRKELGRMNFNDRLKTIYKHHFFLAQKYKEALQKSFLKWGKPVLPSLKFNGSIDKHRTSCDEESEDDEVNFLLSQKRVTQNNSDNEKSDTSKSVSPSSTLQHSNRVNIDIEVNRNDNSSSTPEIVDDLEIIRIDSTKKPRSPQILIPNETETDTHEKEDTDPDFDILVDDLVYKNGPKSRKSYSGNSSRSELMFDNFIVEEQKRKEQQLEMDRFVQTLNVLSDEESSDFVSDKNSNRLKVKSGSGDDAFIVKETQKDDPTRSKRRIVPPNPMINKKKQQVNKKVISGKTPSNKGKPPLKRSKLQNDGYKNNTTISIDKTPEKNKKTCPICDQKILEELIQEHVEVCIESVESKDENEIKCDICDRVFEYNTSYEVHVNKCIETQMRQKV